MFYLFYFSLAVLHSLLSKKSGERYKTFNKLLAQIEQYNKYQTVVRLLGLTNLNLMPRPIEKIRSSILSIELAAPSLDIVATNTGSGFG